MTSPTEIYLPPTLPYPIKAVSLDVNPNASISRGTRLLSYSFVHASAKVGSKPETRFGTWDSATEGRVKAWLIKQGELISHWRAREKPVLLVTEPCKHGVQIGGLCGLCGKDMTDFDYTGFSDTSRASIQMTHSAFGPTVSLEEAQRLERESAEHLLRARKLSLIVDLDQTIVHATVDPTVGEWIAEGEEWEARRAHKADTGEGTSADSSSESASNLDDECNPNWDALKDVRKFRLGPASFIPPHLRGRVKGKQKLGENEGCMYYIKPRPGLPAFLEETAKKYEMHVYTMGTRAYAEEVCTAIDPNGKLFGGRLLSRDESDSLTQKSLQRLFPCDTSMVVIIDDRADVWDWSPNLIKVVPYDFFVGIGDINSAFLPRNEALTSPMLPSTAGSSSSATSTESISNPSAATPSEGAALTAAVTDVAERSANASLALEAQLEQRPLAKKQEELEEAEAKLAGSEAKTPEGEDEQSSNPPKVVHKALLKNDDCELDRLRKLLDEVHRRFFEAYESRLSDTGRSRKRKQGSSSKLREPPRASHDITRIIPQIRSETLQGVHILFSGVIPLFTDPQLNEIWRLAEMFGAVCYTELTDSVTHVVAKRGTVKVHAARKRGDVMIVGLSWLTSCIALWRRVDETPHLLEDTPAAAPGHSSSTTTEQQSAPAEGSTSEFNEGDGAGDGTGEETEPFAINEINWADINDEVEAAMNESDDGDDDDGDDDDSDMSAMRSGNVSENEVSRNAHDGVSSAGNSPRSRRKRFRSLTPSDPGPRNRSDIAGARGPPTKRKRVVSERSSLKEAITADDLVNAADREEAPGAVEVLPTIPMEPSDGEESSEDEAQEEDDFLARELEEEWG